MDEARATGDDVVEVAVDLRGLHEGHVRVLHEWDRLVEKIGFGDEIGIKNDEELSLGDGQRVVDVARLRAGAA